MIFENVSSTMRSFHQNRDEMSPECRQAAPFAAFPTIQRPKLFFQRNAVNLAAGRTENSNDFAIDAAKLHAAA
jgi:hypothetical protein